MFTPFDPLFLAISYLSTLPPHFTSYTDLWDSIAQRPFEALGASEEDAGQFAEDLMRLGQLGLVRERFSAVCDSQGAFRCPFISLSLCSTQRLLILSESRRLRRHAPPSL